MRITLDSTQAAGSVRAPIALPGSAALIVSTGGGGPREGARPRKATSGLLPAETATARSSAARGGASAMRQDYLPTANQMATQMTPRNAAVLPKMTHWVAPGAWRAAAIIAGML